MTWVDLMKQNQVTKKAIELNPGFVIAHYYYSRIKKFDKKDEHFTQMHNLSLNQNLNKEQLSYIFFALAKAYKDLNQLNDSFKCYSKANMFRKELLNYNINKDIRLFNQIKKSFLSIKKNSVIISDRFVKPKIIFIVGMPRSGTTLIEQIISSHSEVIPAGELGYIHQFSNTIAKGEIKINAEILLNFRKNYLEKVQELFGESSMVTDKMPLNFRYIGLISSTFPEAKIIHVKRDAAATCWGNYQKNFNDKNLSYSYDLDDLTTYYRLYQDLMKF